MNDSHIMFSGNYYRLDTVMIDMQWLIFVGLCVTLDGYQSL